MKLEGLHHITMITGDAPRNVEFYADVLGLRMVKKTVNFDAPEAYHLYFGDEQGSPGSILTWFEFPGAAPGRPGAGMIHTIQLAVGDEAALSFWADRLAARGYSAAPIAGGLEFADYDGLRYELLAVGGESPARRPHHPEIPPEHAIAGVYGARAYGAHHAVEDRFLTETLGFAHRGAGDYLIGDDRPFHWGFDPAPETAGRQGAGSVHHIAWATPDAEQPAWQERVREAGAYVTDVRDRDYFTSIYFREPRGVLFEIATLSPGFAVDEDPDHLGEQLRLPRMHEHLRERLERTLTPLVNPRTTWAEQVGA